MRALVVGGTGPTGPYLVRGLLKRGYEVAILHRGSHEVPEIPPEVEHIHVDPYVPEAFEAGIAGREFDLCIAAYGRLRTIAASMKDRTGRFLSCGGGPAYLGYMYPEALDPPGLPVPVAEGAELVASEADDSKGYRIVRTEEAVFAAQPEATHFRYPIVYGPRQPMPREWCIVRRILDGRRRIVVPEGGLTAHHYGYAENVAHALLLSVDQPEASRGKIYNCGDEEVLTLGQVVRLIAAELGVEMEMVSMPYELAKSAWPMVGQPLPTHRVYDLGRLKADLGYADVVPAREAMRRTARWLVENPPERGGMEETALDDPFEYETEDRLMDEWQKVRSAMPEIRWQREPSFNLAYSGPGGRPRSKEFS